MDELEKKVADLNRGLELQEALKKLAPLSTSDAFQKALENLRAMQTSHVKSITMPELMPPRTSINTELLKVAKIPTFEESNAFQSASVLMKRLASAISEWRAKLPEDVQPAVIAILSGGVQINVNSLAQESFHGIRVEGTINGLPCIVLAHQNTIQLVCYPEPINPPELPKRKIGFVIEGEQSEA